MRVAARRARGAAIAIAAGAVLTGALAPQASAASGWLLPFDVSSLGQDGFAPQVAIDPSGNAVAVWEGSSATNANVQAAVLASGTTTSTPVPLSASNVDAAGPQVAVDGNGNAIAVWQRQGSEDVVQAAIRPAGGAFGMPVNLSAADASASPPQLDMNAAGAAIAVWSLLDTGDPVVQAASRPAGGAFATAVPVSAGGGSAENPTVAINTSGDAVVGWLRSGVSSTIVQVATRAGSGSFSAPVDLTTTGAASSPKVAINQAGDIVAAWRRFNGAHHIVQARIRPAGGSFSSVADLSAAGQNANLGDIAIDTAGNALVTWDYPSAANTVVQLARRPAGGSFVATVDLTPLDKTAFNPRLAVNPAGEAIAGWLFSGAANTIVQARAGTTGGTFGPPADLSATGQSADNLDLAINAAGRGIAVWERPNGSNRIVQAARYDEIVAPPPPPRHRLPRLRLRLRHRHRHRHRQSCHRRLHHRRLHHRRLHHRRLQVRTSPRRP